MQKMKKKSEDNGWEHIKYLERVCAISHCDDRARGYIIEKNEKGKSIVTPLCYFHSNIAMSMFVVYDTYEDACIKAGIDPDYSIGDDDGVSGVSIKSLLNVPKRIWRSIFGTRN